MNLCQEKWEPSWATDPDNTMVRIANENYRKTMSQRDEDIERLVGAFAADRTETLEVGKRLKSLPGLRYSSLLKPCVPTMQPLNECIAAIIWELHNYPNFARMLRKESLPDLVTLPRCVDLLRAAALYQSEFQNVGM